MPRRDKGTQRGLWSPSPAEFPSPHLVHSLCSSLRGQCSTWTTPFISIVLAVKGEVKSSSRSLPPFSLFFLTFLPVCLSINGQPLMVSEASLVSVTVHTRPWSPTMCHDVPAFSSGSRVSISIRTRQPTLPLRCLSHNASQTRLHVCFFPLSLWPPSCLEPLLSVTPLVRQTALHRNPVFPSTISHGAAAVG